MTTPGSNFADKPVDPSPIPRDILDTNNPPAEYNHPALRAFSVLDATITALKAELSKLLEERESLDAEVRKHEGALSPLRRMPVEIVSLIFKFAAPFRSYVMSVKEGPWILSAVCSRWRTIALSQPNLWAEFVLNFVDDPDISESAGRILPLVEAHLERSQKLPLAITFFPYEELECTEAEQALLDLLAAHCDRWETVALYGSTLLYDTLIGSIYGRLPILRKLDIRFCPQFKPDDELEVDILRPLCGFASNHWPNHVHVLTSAVNLVDCVLRLIQPERGTCTGKPDRATCRSSPPPLHVDGGRARLSGDSCLAGALLLRPFQQPPLIFEARARPAASFSLQIPSLLRDIGLLLHAAPTITNLFLYGLYALCARPIGAPRTSDSPYG
ncbi:hypothetical protein B0H14DRAFT_3773701 [Mycena olivaceomarginata]|nr:hypothetical protein B0H14DRAFT_3773701 [Mycena olivaceomarginata]